MFEWHSKTGRYRDISNKRFVPRSVVLKHIDRQNKRSKAYLQKQAKRLVDRKISLSQFQAIAIEEIKRSNIRMALLASGGKNGISQKEWGTTGAILKQEYKYLANFVNAIARGELTPERIIWRAGLYGNSSSESFFASEKTNRLRSVPNGLIAIAMRWLDSQAQHCEDCPNYSTNGKWWLASSVVPPARRCRCKRRCKCGIKYKYIKPSELSKYVSLEDRLVG